MGGVEYISWLRAIGRERTVGYRWVELGWVKVQNISGHPFITQKEINSFWLRAEQGEFALEPKGAAFKK